MDQKKFDYIQSQIKEANLALQTWNDRRAEAMIELDSIFCEIEAMKEKSRKESEVSQATIAELKSTIARNENSFTNHFESYTNELQELMLTNEGLSEHLKNARDEIEGLKRAQKKAEKDYVGNVAKIQSEAEIRSADQVFQLKTKISEMNMQLQSAEAEKQALVYKNECYEKEIQSIRSQMMSVLKAANAMNAIAGAGGSGGGEIPVTAPVPAPAVSTSVSAKVAPVSTDVPARKEEKSPAPVTAGDFATPAASSLPTSVNDYLKKFGY